MSTILPHFKIKLMVFHGCIVNSCLQFPNQVTNKINIAIDGYSSCGKSTTARHVAAALHYAFLDTGAMYRAVALYFHRQQVDLADLQAVKLTGLAQQPMYDPISQLVYTDSSRATEYVWVAGKALLDSGELTTLNENTLRQQTQYWQQQIANA